MKLPSWLTSLKIPGLQRRTEPGPARTPARQLRAGTTYRARGRTAEPEDFEEEDEQPTTRLSTAFIVVVALHLVLVGGIYAFNSIKANRPPADARVDKPKNAAPKQTAAAPTEKPPVTQASNPSPSSAAPAAPPAPRSTGSTLPIANTRIHKVVQGETLTSIAQDYKVTVASLAEANGLERNAVLRPGKALNIPAARAAGAGKGGVDARERYVEAREEAAAAQKKTASASTPKAASTSTPKSVPKTHTVSKNETITAIGKKYGISAADIMKANNISDPTKVQIGQELKLPQNRTASAK